MSRYDSDTLVRVRPFQRRIEGDSATIGDVARQVYLTIPAQGLVILDYLSDGKTVGEAQELFAATYGETPDMDDFLGALEPEGFVALADDDAVPLDAEESGARQEPRWLSQAWCRRLCGPWVGAVILAMVVAALAMIVSDPRVVPGWSSLVFKQDFVPLVLGVSLFAIATTALHEVAHLVAARAAGVPARIQVSHRLWILVAETDMTGIWMASKRDRYRAFLAGSLVDAASASLFVALLWAHQRAGLGLPPLAVRVASACLFVYLLRILWQCFVFVRTDFYFVISTALNCKNLLEDTTDYLRGRVAVMLHRPERATDQSHIPPSEMHIVRWYAPVYLAGRVVAFATLLLVTLPIMGTYLVGIAPMLVGRRSSYGVLDALVFALLELSVTAAGLAMWVRSLLQKIRERKSHAVNRAALQHS